MPSHLRKGSGVGFGTCVCDLDLLLGGLWGEGGVCVEQHDAVNHDRRARFFFACRSRALPALATVYHPVGV
jgi:hypothetical protein